MSRVVGLDLSLTSTGLALVGDGPITTWGIQSRAPKTPRHPRTGKPLPPTLIQRHNRLISLATNILIVVLRPERLPDLVVVEQPAFSRNLGSTHDRSGLWWLVVSGLYRAKVQVAEVTPNQRAKYATGKGTADKDAVILAVERRYPEARVNGNDEADALILAAMGKRWLGEPIDDMPKVHLEAFDSVAWPTPNGREPPS
ncbi:MAG: hypothetical protein ACRD0W_12560 [Acidimicrobiales bacterium]